MTVEIDIKDKSTKDVILEYLKLNHGREIAVSEISEKFNFKLNRISNAIKELEFTGQIVIERRPLKKGKYTVIYLRGDTITEYATHERAIEIPPKHVEPISSDQFSIEDAIRKLKSPNYMESKFKELIEPFYENYLTLITEIIQPILYQTGTMWEKEIITVGEEHIISARLEKFLISLILKENKRNKDKIVILSPVENESHTLVLLALELLLLERGFTVINLSRSISILSIIDFVKKMKTKPEWILFSITMESYVRNLAIDIKLIKEEYPEINVAIGGQGIKKIKTSNFENAKIIKTSEELQEFFYAM